MRHAYRRLFEALCNMNSYRTRYIKRRESGGSPTNSHMKMFTIGIDVYSLSNYHLHCAPKKVATFLFFLKNSVKNKPICISFGTPNPEEILYKCFWTCPPHLKNVATVPCEMQKMSCSTAAESGHAFRAWIRIYFFTHEKNVYCSYFVNLQNYLIYTAVANKKRDVC